MLQSVCIVLSFLKIPAVRIRRKMIAKPIIIPDGKPIGTKSTQVTFRFQMPIRNSSFYDSCIEASGQVNLHRAHEFANNLSRKCKYFRKFAFARSMQKG